eukprot:gene2254-3126_t
MAPKKKRATAKAAAPSAPAKNAPRQSPGPDMADDQFRCPYCSAGNPVHAPLASTFPPHKGLSCQLSGRENFPTPMCEDCPEEHPNPATLHCPGCENNRCDQCDKAVHST